MPQSHRHAVHGQSGLDFHRPVNGRNLLMLGNHRACTDYDIVPNLRITEQNGSHPDQAVIPDLTGMDHCIMSDNNLIPDFCRRIPHDMDRRIILDIGILANGNLLEISADYGVEPDA